MTPLTRIVLATLSVALLSSCAGQASHSRQQPVGSLLGSSHSPNATEKRGYRFSVKVRGDDLVVEDAICTNFGGVGDYQDNGETEGGVQLRRGGKDIFVPGCSLPMRGYTERHYSGADTSTSPIPALPYQTTKVEVTYKGKSIVVPLIERGPGPNSPSHAALDLTFQSFREFAPLQVGTLYGVTFRIIGAAKYLKTPYVPPDARTL